MACKYSDSCFGSADIFVSNTFRVPSQNLVRDAPCVQQTKAQQQLLSDNFHIKRRQEMRSPHNLYRGSYINAVPHMITKLQLDFSALTFLPFEATVTDFKLIHKSACMKKPCFRQQVLKWF